MVYVALLRGINVGGKNIIPMTALVTAFEGMRFSNVRTFIASGNVIFETKTTSPRALEVKIEKALHAELGYAGKVVVKSRDEMLAIMKKLPAAWKKPSPTMRYYVVFLRHAIDSKKIVDSLKVDPKIETVTYVPGALLWSAKASELPGSLMAKVMATPIYQDVTVRNLNTTKKLAELVT